jgi:uncharacterized cupin superfamily protein
MDGAIDHGVWEIVAGRFHPTFPRYGEIFRVVSGELRCTPDDGSAPFILHPGDWMTFPRGWTGIWEMPRPLRKLFVTWTAW